jgi:hypothetical protein
MIGAGSGASRRRRASATPKAAAARPSAPTSARGVCPWARRAPETGDPCADSASSLRRASRPGGGLASEPRTGGATDRRRATTVATAARTRVATWACASVAADGAHGSPVARPGWSTTWRLPNGLRTQPPAPDADAEGVTAASVTGVGVDVEAGAGTPDGASTGVAEVAGGAAEGFSAESCAGEGCSSATAGTLCGGESATGSSAVGSPQSPPAADGGDSLWAPCSVRGACGAEVVGACAERG